jgi:VanZ family protein
MDGEVSATESGGLLNLVKAIFDFLPLTEDLTEHILRKLAHFTEFACLGFLLGADTLLFVKNGSDIIKHKIYLPAFGGLLAAQVDETIQLFVPGRSSQVKDVWIDFSGVVIGVIAVFVIYAVMRKIRKEKQR